MMMINLGIFTRLAELTISAKHRQQQEYADFMAFYRGLVETVPTEAATAFGNLSVDVVTNGKIGQAGIELTATDYMWWKGKFDTGEYRFHKRPASVQLDMLNRFAKKAEIIGLSPDERKSLIAMLSEATEPTA